MSNNCGKVKLKLVGSDKEKIKDKVTKVLAEVKKTAAKKNITVSGDLKSGDIDGRKEWKIWGTYSIEMDEKKNEAAVEVAMEEDHWAVSCDYVNDLIKEWFKGK